VIVAACAHTDPCLRPHRPGVVPGGTKRPERCTTGKGRQATSRIQETRPSSINMSCLITLERSGTLPGIAVIVIMLMLRPPQPMEMHTSNGDAPLGALPVVFLIVRRTLIHEHPRSGSCSSPVGSPAQEGLLPSSFGSPLCCCQRQDRTFEIESSRTFTASSLERVRPGHSRIPCLLHRRPRQGVQKCNFLARFNLTLNGRALEEMGFVG